MTTRNQAILQIFVLPFIVSASIELLPGWLCWPIVFLSAASFAGSVIIIADKETE